MRDAGLATSGYGGQRPLKEHCTAARAHQDFRSRPGVDQTISSETSGSGRRPDRSAASATSSLDTELEECSTSVFLQSEECSTSVFLQSIVGAAVGGRIACTGGG